jgi:hypothetical protein
MLIATAATIGLGVHLWRRCDLFQAGRAWPQNNMLVVLAAVFRQNSRAPNARS